MSSKRFKKLPEKTKDLTADVIENLYQSTHQILLYNFF